MCRRIVYRMKITALIADDLVHDVTEYSQGKNTTEALVIALREWVALKKLQHLNEEVRARPLSFSTVYSAQKVRALGRRKRA